VAEGVKSGEKTALRRSFRGWCRQHAFALRLRFAQSRVGRRSFRAQRFLFMPPHLEVSDISIAGDIAAGQIVLAGRSLLTGGLSPFDCPAPSRKFSEELQGFQWLVHFDTLENARNRDAARARVGEFMARREADPAFAILTPVVVAKRMFAWLTHCALLCENGDIHHYKRLLAHLARDGALLRLYAQRSGLGTGRLYAAIGLLYHALCLNGTSRAINQAEDLLRAALDDAMTPDGGTRDRNAAHVADLAAHLIPLLALYRIRQANPPGFLNPALLRMVGFLCMMQHPDGGLALFNGAGIAARDRINAITQFSGGRVSRLDSAPETGFERLENQQAIVIADSGMHPPAAYASQAGVSALAFEFSTRSNRVIVNCGTPPAAEGEVAALYRVSAAHSGIMMDGEGLGRLVPVVNGLGLPEMALVANATGVAPQRKHTAAGEVLTLGHGGFLAAFGYMMERRLTLMQPEAGLLGLDRFMDVDGKGIPRRITLAFHLHPGVIPSRMPRPDCMMLRLPNQKPGRDLWLFEAPDCPLQLDESRCFQQESSQIKTTQILLEREITGSIDIAWRLTPYRGERR